MRSRWLASRNGGHQVLWLLSLCCRKWKIYGGHPDAHEHDENVDSNATRGFRDGCKEYPSPINIHLLSVPIERRIGNSQALEQHQHVSYRRLPIVPCCIFLFPVFQRERRIRFVEGWSFGSREHLNVEFIEAIPLPPRSPFPH